MDGNISLDEDSQIDDGVQKNDVITLDDEPYTVPPEEKEIDRTPTPVPPELKNILKNYDTLQDVVNDEQMSRWLDGEFRFYQFFHPCRQERITNFPLKISPHLIIEYFEMKRKQVFENEAAPYGHRGQLFALYNLFQNEPNIDNVDLGSFEKSHKISKGHVKEYYKWRKQRKEENSMERVRPWVEAIRLNGNISLDEDFQIDDDVQKNYVITLDDEPYTAPPEEKEIDRIPSPVPPELKSFLKSYKTLQDVVEDEQMSRWLNQEFRNYQFFHPTRQANFESFPLKISPQLVAEYFEMKRKKFLKQIRIRMRSTTNFMLSMNYIELNLTSKTWISEILRKVKKYQKAISRNTTNGESRWKRKIKKKQRFQKNQEKKKNMKERLSKSQ
ncbi:hypothetical protein L5515_019504 [Caenorhabditis briggsae]|uniref:Uncharacterized protein n=1 Tax=Caenorhabditis briggsae TaxID=6238 RepID=A0AAE9FLX7_CAEBR|nr:hypothetical protein L5515_019504 [Caenorhabditis briggsae]